MFPGALGEDGNDLGVVIPDFQNDRLKAYLESLPWSEFTDKEDITVYSVLLAFDRFRIEDLNFEFGDPAVLPTPGPLREICEWLYAPKNRDLLTVYCQKNCRSVKMNPLAEKLWGRLREIHQIED